MNEVKAALGARLCLSLTLAVLLLAIGFVAVVDLLVHTDPRPHMWALLPSTIVLLGGVGGVYLGYLFGLRYLVLLLVPLLLAASGVIALNHLVALPFLTELDGFPQHRVTTALLVLFIGLAFISSALNVRSRAVASVSGVVVVIIGLLSLGSVWLDFLSVFSLGFRPEANLLFGPFAVLGGISILGLAPMERTASTSIPKRIWLPSMGCVIISALCWYAVRAHQVNDLSGQGEQFAHHVEVMLKNKYDGELAMVTRMAERWHTLDGVPDRDHFATEAKTYLRDFPELALVGVLSGRGQILFVDAIDDDITHAVVQHFQNGANRNWLQHVGKHQETHLGPIFESADQRKLALLAAPIHIGDSTPKYVLAVVDARKFSEELLQHHQTPFELSLTRGDNRLYDSSPATSLREASVISDVKVRLHHSDIWNIRIYTKTIGFSAEEFYLPSFILFSGGLLSFLLTYSQALGGHAKRQTIAYAQLNDKLVEHLERERELSHINSRIMFFSKDILCSMDAFGNLIKVNPAAYQVLGYQPAELEGSNVGDLLTGIDRINTMAVIRDAAGGKPVDEFRSYCKSKDGHDVLLLWSIEWSEEDHALFCVARDITASVTAELLAKEQEAFFALTPEMFCIVDINGYFFEANNAFSEVLGFRKEALIGSPYLDLVFQQDRRKVLLAVKSLMIGGHIRGLEIRATDIRGQQHWLELNAAMSDDELIYCAARDITAMKQTRLDLEQSRSLLQIAEQTALLGGWQLDRDGSNPRWTEMVYQIHGLPPQGQPPALDEALHHFRPEDQQRVTDVVGACFRHGKSFDEEFQFVSATGEEKWVRAIGSAVRDVNGEIIRLQGALQDITQYKRSKEQLRRLDERLSTIFESITDAFLTLDRSWRFTRVNSKSEQLLQRSREEMLGESVWEVFPEAVGTEFEAKYRHAMETGETVFFEAYYEALDDWIEVTAYPSDEGLAVYFRSIRARKVAEANLKKTLTELERSNRELESFAFVASHDLQEPLRKIQTFAGRLNSSSGQLGERERDYIGRMQSAAERMQALIRDLLSYSRITTQAKPFEHCDTQTLIAEVLSDMEAVIQAENALIEVDSVLPPVSGDRVQLRQVFQNLISNAIKFHPKNTRPHVLISASCVTGEDWTLSIQDFGVGFDSKYAEKIFEPFQRLHRREEFAGTGIGLAVVKKVLDRHGANIHVKSIPGEGTTFQIVFPLHEREERKRA